MSKYNISVASNHKCILGEGPHWDDKSQKLYYVDAFAGDVCQLDINTKVYEKIHIDDSIVSVVIPCNDNDHFIVSNEKKLLKLNWSTEESQLITEIEKSIDGNRFNDGKCDANGRLWIGTMGSESSPGVVHPDRGSLYCMDNKYNIEHKVGNVSLSNGMAWSLDNNNMFYIDSTKRKVYVFDYDLSTGNVANQRVMVDYNGNSDFSERELPDGMTIDKRGNLWIACFFGSRVVKVDPNTGRVIDVVTLPAEKITSVCFGGPQLTQLYVTCASKDLTDQQLKAQPHAGHVLKVTCDNDASFAGAEPHYTFAL